MNRNIQVISSILLSAMVAVACAPGREDGSAAPAAKPDTLVTVNGHPITNYDLIYQLARNKVLGNADDEVRRQTLETLIAQELSAQGAVALGLELEPDAERQLLARQAEVDAMRRSRFAELYVQKGLAPKALASDEEVRQYFEENRDKLQLEFQVGRILRRSEREIQDDYNAIQGGLSFEEVAARPFTGEAAKAREPWVLNYLPWYQLPETWREVVLALQVGEVSGIVRGEDDRYWIIKMLDRREREGRSFEQLEERLRAQLSGSALHDLREASLEQLRQEATIVYTEEQQP